MQLLERDALDRLAAGYRSRLVAYAARIVDRSEAEDVVQEALLRACSELDLGAPGSAAGWLYAVTYRLAIDRRRARERQTRLRPEAPEAAVAGDGEMTRRVREHVHALEEPYRTALTLRYLEALDFAEIAERLGTIERTARTWVGRGLGRLRERLRGVL
jgi:RNA polymerase sigma-70 factor (ECF subfamily)